MSEKQNALTDKGVLEMFRKSFHCRTDSRQKNGKLVSYKKMKLRYN